MEKIFDTNPMAPKVSPEELAQLQAAMEEMANQPVTTDDHEPTDAELVLH